MANSGGVVRTFSGSSGAIAAARSLSFPRRAPFSFTETGQTKVDPTRDIRWVLARTPRIGAHIWRTLPARNVLVHAGCHWARSRTRQPFTDSRTHLFRAAPRVVSQI